MFETLKKLLLIPALLFCGMLLAQDSSISGNHQSFTPSKSRIYVASAASVVAYGGGLIALSNAWYQHYPQSSFHFFNDNNDWLQMDKAGHIFGAYTAGKFSAEAWRWAGLTRKQRIWVGGLSGTAFMTIIEILDGFSSGWGFSMADLGANLVGGGVYMAQELAWNEQKIQLKFSFHRNHYEEPALTQRANELFGSNTLERMLKDYNGQTYWASANLKSFLKNSRLPPWLNIAVGYGAEGMFGGSDNISRDKNSILVFNRTDIPRYRQWYLAPDIDLTRIKTKSKFLKTAFFLLNTFKFPTPAISFSKKGIEWNWMMF